MDYDFAKNNEVETLDAVPQDLRSFYKETDGKYKLDSENPAVNSAVSLLSKLNQTLKASRKEADGYKAKAVDLSSLADYGSTPDEIKAGIEKKLEEMSTGNKDAKLNLEKIKADLAAGHAKDLEAKDTKVNALTNQLYSLMVENAATASISELKGNVKLLMPFIKDQVKVVEEDGEFKVFVVDKANERRYSGTTGAPMTIKELVAELKANAEFGGAFMSEAPSGNGVKPGTATKPVKVPNEASQSPVSKIAAGLAKRK